MKTLKFCNNGFTAEIIKGRLADAGIEAQVLHSTISQVAPQYSASPSLQPQVVVREEDYGQALDILGEDAGELTVCPQCGSDKVYYGVQGDKWWMKIVWFLLILFPVTGRLRGSYYCRKCKWRAGMDESPEN